METAEREKEKGGKPASLKDLLSKKTHAPQPWHIVGFTHGTDKKFYYLSIKYNHSPRKVIIKQYPFSVPPKKNKAVTFEDYSLKIFHGGDAGN